MEAFDADVFLVILPENLDELLMKDVFETIFCLHEVRLNTASCPFILYLFVTFLYSEQD